MVFTEILREKNADAMVLDPRNAIGTSDLTCSTFLHLDITGQEAAKLHS